MFPRVAVPFIAAAIVFFACGPRAPSPLATARPRASAGQGVVSHVAVDSAQGNVRFSIDVANDSRKRVELDFPDGRTHDFAVLDSTGREVWRWSEGRLFTQAMQNRLLDADNHVVYSERWSPAGRGRYTLVAQLHSSNYPLQQQVQFTLP